MPQTREFQVCIIEDSQPFALRMKAALEEIPRLEVVGVAETPSEAIKMIGAQQPHLVLLDISLSGGNGIDVLRAIKNDGFPGVVLMMTSQPSEQVRAACLKLEAAELFDKVEVDQLLTTVADLASKHKQ
ncbi:MAG TPA: response regulator [Bryobacteraceae bacterium]|jgi:Response regulator containing a CheY-like receiver domain and an HTH DNA-binding domain|nr:response regulator [Bryobacteraceae bacterium]